MRYRDDMMNKMPYMNNVNVMGTMMQNGSYMGEPNSSALGAQMLPKTMPEAGSGKMPATMPAAGGKTMPEAGFKTSPSAGAYPLPAPAAGMYPSPAAGSGMIPAAFPATAAITTTSPAVPSASVFGAQAYPSATMQSGAGTAPTAPGWTQMPTTVESPLFTPGFLRTQIGRRVRVEFLIGTNNLTDRTGTLVAVGASYILIRPIDSDDLMMCDIYSIKFVTIIL